MRVGAPPVARQWASVTVLSGFQRRTRPGLRDEGEVLWHHRGWRLEEGRKAVRVDRRHPVAGKEGGDLLLRSKGVRGSGGVRHIRQERVRVLWKRRVSGECQV